VSSGEVTQSVFDALETQPQPFPVGALLFILSHCFKSSSFAKTQNSYYP
jgi:hypothetical protein